MYYVDRLNMDLLAIEELFLLLCRSDHPITHITTMIISLLKTAKKLYIKFPQVNYIEIHTFPLQSTTLFEIL